LEKSKTSLFICKNEEKCHKKARIKRTGSNIRLHRFRFGRNKRTGWRMEMVHNKSSKYYALIMVVYNQLFNCLFNVHDTFIVGFPSAYSIYNHIWAIYRFMFVVRYIPYFFQAWWALKACKYKSV
jgi:hypothetical protein